MLYLGLFAAVMIAGNILVERFDTAVLPEEIAAKYAHFKQHKDEYDLIFIGPSFVLRSIDPVRFDARMRAAGYEVKSFNFGIPGMRFHEGRVLLDRILALDPARLKWVITDITALEVETVHDENWLSLRTAWWHGLGATRDVCLAVLSEDEPLGVRIHEVYGHVLHMLLKGFHVGLARRMLLDPPVLAAVKNEGFESLEDHYEDVSPEDRARHRAFMEGIEQYEKDVNQLEKNWGQYEERVAGAAAPAWAVRAVREDVASLRGAGIEPLYMLAPGLRMKAPALWLYRYGHIPELFAYNHPQRFSELYQKDMRYDATHVNAAGAARLTELMADDFVQYLERKP